MEDVKTYRFDIIKSLIKDLEKDEERYILKVRNRREKNSFYKKFNVTISVFSITSTKVLAILSNQQLLNPSIMVIVISIISTVCSSASLFIANFTLNSEQKRSLYKNLMSLARDHILKLESLLSEILEKNDVSNEDFKFILSFKSNYDKAKDDIRKKHNEI